MSKENICPLPLFDTIEHIEKQNNFSYLNADYSREDISKALTFLKAYNGSQGTFNSYRREIERLFHWCALEAKKSIAQLKRDDIETFVHFCQKPPKEWIGTTKPPRFVEKDGLRIPNTQWRPFIISVSKAQRRKGLDESTQKFELSQGSLKELFAILSTFYNFLLQEEYALLNPVALIRQKSKFIRKAQGQTKIRRLTELQWQYVIQTATELADKEPIKYERTLFMLSALFSMYLRISELVSSERWSPSMNHFSRDGDGNWWFVTVGKGNKERQIAVSDTMIKALKRWRQHLGLSLLPSPADQSPMLPKTKGSGPIKSTNFVRKIIQEAFDTAIKNLTQDGLAEEAETLNEATVHWLRHTGISEDVKTRPREHVRDDAGHSSSATTDKYIDIELRERHLSAKKKIIDQTS